MKKTRIFAACLVSLLLTAGAALQAQTVPFDLELGWQWVNVDGNEDVYKTQMNEQQGFLLRSFTMLTSNFNGKTDLVDRFRIDATDLGNASPAGSLRLEASRDDSYRFTLGYRTMDSFSALPGFANPLLSQGIVPGQHTWDQTRNMLDADLEFLPGHRFVPFVGISWNRLNGPGTTTYNLGGDEFKLDSDLTDTDTEYRAGVAFNLGNVYGQVTQGWRDYKGTEHLTLSSGAGSGNNPGSVLGQPVTADTITRNSKTDVTTPFTNIYVTGQASDRVKLTGTYVRFAADLDGNESEDSAGSFVSFPISRFFSGLTEDVSSKAKNTTWRGGARAEVTVSQGVDVIAGYRKEHRELEGSALFNSLFLDAITFGGVSVGDLRTTLATDNSLTRDEDVWDLGLVAHPVGAFSVRAGYSQTSQDATVSPDLEEIVVPGNQSGDFSRTIKSFNAGATYTMSGATVTAQWKRDTADDPIVRTDFLDRNRYRVRAAWKTPGNMFRFGVTGDKTDQSNDRTGIGYDATVKQYSADAEVVPVAPLSIHASYSKFDSDSSIVYRIPQNFDLGTSVQTEDGKSVEGGLTLSIKKVMLDAAAGKFDNDGTNPLKLDRYRARVTFDFIAKAGIAAEWSRDKYRETNDALANYEADRYGLFLRWHP
ncbi:MAG: hypothetical protein WBX15_05965 [Thermoanaerobaculia bacterium]